MQSAPTLEQLLSDSCELYSLPAVAVEVLELTADPRVDVARLTACLQRDPALVSKVLRVVNSSLFGLTRQVADLNQAVTLLGIKPLKLLVLGFSLPPALLADVDAELLAGYWRHTLTRAVAAHVVCERLNVGSPDEAFIAGLLADVGMLVLIQHMGPPYVRFVQRVRQAERELEEAERLTLGFGHSQLTVQLLASWSLPPLLTDATAAAMCPDDEFLEPLDAACQSLARTLRFAEGLAQLLADGRRDAMPGVLHSAAREQHVTAEQLDRLVDDVEQKVAQLAGVLRLDICTPLEYAKVLARAREHLVTVATEAAGELTYANFLDHDRDDEMGGPWLESGPTAPRAGVVAVPVGKPPTVSEHGPASAVNGDAPEAPPLPIRTAVDVCRQNHWSLSLLLAQLDHWSQVTNEHGERAAASWLRQFESTCRQTDHPGMLAIHQRPGRMALLLPACDRGKLVELGHELLRRFRQLGAGASRPIWTVSLGAATLTTPSRNFQPGDMETAAERCLASAQTGGGNLLKSIEIY